MPVLKFLILLVAVTLPTAFASASTVTDPAIGYSFDLPEGWKPVPEALTQMWRDAPGTSRPSSMFTFVAAYEAPGPEGAFTFPCLLIQETPYAPGNHLDSITEIGLQKMTAIITAAHVDDLRKTDFTDFSGPNLAFLSQGGVAYLVNPPGYRRGVSGVTKSVNFRGVVQGLFAKDRLITVDLYAKLDDWDQSWPTLKNIASSFRLTPNQEIKLQPDAGWTTYAIYFAVAAVVAVLWTIFKRTPRRPAAKQ